MQINWAFLFNLLGLADMSSLTSVTRAAVYRGPASPPGTAESAAALIKAVRKDAKIKYIGPDEDEDVSEQSLKGMDVYIQPGGGDLAPAWKHMKLHTKTIQHFISSGGTYIGFCLGAYLAGQNPPGGFDLLPRDAYADDEYQQENAQVKNDRDTVIQVDWTFTNGTREDGRWLYFQDGACIKDLPREEKGKGKEYEVLGRYSKSGDVAGVVVRYGKGAVGVVGPHPEADKTWYDGEGFTNPDGYNLTIGRDFVQAVLEFRAQES